MSTTPFTWQDGLALQAQDLAFWEARLKPEIFARVKARVQLDTDNMEHELLSDPEFLNGPVAGHCVPRGQDIHNIVMNLEV